jgi:hypothetical protein
VPRLAQHQSDECQSAIGAWDAWVAAHPGAKDVTQGLPGAGAEKSVVRAPACPARHVPAPQHRRQQLGSGQELYTPDAAQCAEQSCADPPAADAAELLELQSVSSGPSVLSVPALRARLVQLGLQPAPAPAPVLAAESLALLESAVPQLVEAEPAR